MKIFNKSLKKKIINYFQSLLIISLFVLGLLFAALTCVGLDKILEARLNPAPKHNPKVVKQIKDGFMEGCLEEGGSKAYCLCIWNNLEKKYTDKELINIAIDYYYTEKFPAAIENIIISCMDFQEEYGYEN